MVPLWGRTHSVAQLGLPARQPLDAVAAVGGGGFASSMALVGRQGCGQSDQLEQPWTGREAEVAMRTCKHANMQTCKQCMGQVGFGKAAFLHDGVALAFSFLLFLSQSTFFNNTLHVLSFSLFFAFSPSSLPHCTRPRLLVDHYEYHLRPYRPANRYPRGIHQL